MSKAQKILAFNSNVSAWDVLIRESEAIQVDAQRMLRALENSSQQSIRSAILLSTMSFSRSVCFRLIVLGIRVRLSFCVVPRFATEIRFGR